LDEILSLVSNSRKTFDTDV